MSREPTKKPGGKPAHTPDKPPVEHEEVKEVLSKPPKDKREIVIAPNKDVGPDVSLE